MNTPDQIAKSDLIANLTSFNAHTLEKMNPQTRGFWSKLLTVCAVAGADVCGAVEGGKIGGGIGAMAGPQGAVAGAAVGGLICGAGASYMAVKACEEEVAVDFSAIEEPIYFDPLIFYRAYMATKLEDEGITTRSMRTRPLPGNEDEEVNIEIPEEYSDCEDIAISHNEVLALVLEGNTFSEIEITDPVTKEFASEVFLKDYQSMIDNITKSVNVLNVVDIDSFFNNMNSDLYSPAYRSIVTLFYDIYTKYPQKMEDIDFIVNYYINAIYESGEITNEEKKSLITALAVAAYSPRFWIDRINVDKNSDYDGII